MEHSSLTGVEKKKGGAAYTIMKNVPVLKHPKGAS
jgi:hypothetical protein